MQNRYVADIGDYVKLAILRALAPGRRLGVVWWLFPNENHNADGGHRDYIKQRDRWKHFDPVLFEALSNIEDEKKTGRARYRGVCCPSECPFCI